jgi:hypothetical protein
MYGLPGNREFTGNGLFFLERMAIGCLRDMPWKRWRFAGFLRGADKLIAPSCRYPR